MKAEDLMKYLGCTVLGLVLIYLIGVVLKVNNDFVGSVLGGNFIEGLTNKEQKQEAEKNKQIDNGVKIAGDMLAFIKGMGVDPFIGGRKDKIQKILDDWKEIMMVGTITQFAQMKDKDAFQFDKWTKETLKPKATIEVLTLINEVQEYLDGK